MLGRMTASVTICFHCIYLFLYNLSKWRLAVIQLIFSVKRKSVSQYRFGTTQEKKKKSNQTYYAHKIWYFSVVYS